MTFKLSYTTADQDTNVTENSLASTHSLPPLEKPSWPGKRRKNKTEKAVAYQYATLPQIAAAFQTVSDETQGVGAPSAALIVQNAGALHPTVDPLKWERIQGAESNRDCDDVDVGLQGSDGKKMEKKCQKI